MCVFLHDLSLNVEHYSTRAMLLDMDKILFVFTTVHGPGVTYLCVGNLVVHMFCRQYMNGCGNYI